MIRDKIKNKILFTILSPLYTIYNYKYKEVLMLYTA